MTGQDDTRIPLYRRYPGLERIAPRVPLADLPTPLERLAGFGDAAAWVKRDDLTGSLYGGNKVRKLEFLLAAARAAGAERLVTIGAIGSHHALATTVYGRREGFAVTAVLLPQPLTAHVQGVLGGMVAAGAEVRIVSGPATVPIGIARARIAHLRERVRAIPAGGSDALGTLGYVNAALELEEQRAATGCPAPAEIHVAGGTLGTAAGLAIGCAIAGMPARIHAHRITSRAITNDRRARRLIGDTLSLLADTGSSVPSASEIADRLIISHEQIGRGYGHPTPAAEEALRRFGAAGIGLDLTYTAKAAAGFVAAVEADPATPRLYWHTLSVVEPPTSFDSIDIGNLPTAARRFLQPIDRSGPRS